MCHDKVVDRTVYANVSIQVSKYKGEEFTHFQSNVYIYLFPPRKRFTFLIKNMTETIAFLFPSNQDINCFICQTFVAVQKICFAPNYWDTTERHQERNNSLERSHIVHKTFPRVFHIARSLPSVSLYVRCQALRNLILQKC